MEIERNNDAGIDIFHIKGSFDTNTSIIVEEQFNAAIDDGGNKLIANFEHVDYVSSAGLRVLLASTKKLRGNGGDLHVCTLNQVAQEVFDISGFSMILNVFSTEEEARNAFS